MRPRGGTGPAPHVPLGTVPARVLASALDALSAAILILDADGRVWHANHSARELLRRGDGMRVANGRLVCARSTDHQALRSALALAAASPSSGAGPGTSSFRVFRPSLNRDLGVFVSPLTRDGTASPVGSLQSGEVGFVLLEVTDPAEVVAISPEHVARIFGLTPSESRLAAALAARASLAEYAARAGVKRETARWTLKRVLQKTGCRRQSELVLAVALASGVTGRRPGGAEGAPLRTSHTGGDGSSPGG